MYIVGLLNSSIWIQVEGVMVLYSRYHYQITLPQVEVLLVTDFKNHTALQVTF